MRWPLEEKVVWFDVTLNKVSLNKVALNKVTTFQGALNEVEEMKKVASNEVASNKVASNKVALSKVALTPPGAADSHCVPIPYTPCGRDNTCASSSIPAKISVGIAFGSLTRHLPICSVQSCVLQRTRLSPVRLQDLARLISIFVSSFDTAEGNKGQSCSCPP